MKFGRFDRWMVLILVALALVLGGVAFFSEQSGLTPPVLSAKQVGGWGPIGLTFDRPMQTGEVESRWQIQPAVQGRFAWAGQTLWFFPSAALTPGKVYALQVKPGAAATDGQVIKQTTAWTISVRAAEILYISPVEEGSEVWKVAQDGTDRVQLTRTGDKVLDFSGSYDGEWLAYSAVNEQGGSDVWVIDRSGGASRKLVNCAGDSCSQPAWSPDRLWIAYSRIRKSVAPGEAYSALPRIWTVEVASGKTAALFQDEKISGVNPSWAPDGKHLAFFDPPAKVIHVLVLDSGKEWMLKSQMGEVAAWSADGQKLWYGDLVSSDTVPFGSAFVADLATEKVQELFTGLPDPEDYGLPAPTPDGTWLAVGVRFTGGSRSIQLQFMRPDGSNRQAITSDHTYTQGAYSWDPTGTMLVYQRILIGSSQSQPEIWVWDRTRGTAKKLVENAALPAWLP